MRHFISVLVVGFVLLAERVPLFDLGGASRAAAQVAVIGGGTTFGFGGGFGTFGSQSSFATETSLVVTPGMSVGAVTFGPYGALGPYYGTGPYVGYAPGGYGFAGYPFVPYSSYGWGRGWGGYWGRPYWGGFAPPPAILPAETIYGPGPVRRMMGLDPPLGTPIVNNTTIFNPAGAGGNAFGVGAGGVNVPNANAQATNAAARERSRKQLAIGDEAFRKQNYGEAWTAYKEAARAAPDLADAYFHQAAAAVAQRRYGAAVDAVKYGLKVSKSYLDGEFKYSQMYGDNKLAQTAHLEALAKAASEAPDSDLYFLTGVMLFFDAEPRRATPFFDKAKQLAIGETWHIDVFIEILRRMNERGGPIVEAPPAANPPRVPVVQDAAGQEI